MKGKTRSFVIALFVVFALSTAVAWAAGGLGRNQNSVPLSIELQGEVGPPLELEQDLVALPGPWVPGKKVAEGTLSVTNLADVPFWGAITIPESEISPFTLVLKEDGQSVKEKPFLPGATRFFQTEIYIHPWYQPGTEIELSNLIVMWEYREPEFPPQGPHPSGKG